MNHWLRNYDLKHAQHWFFAEDNSCCKITKVLKCLISPNLYFGMQFCVPDSYGYSCFVNSLGQPAKGTIRVECKNKFVEEWYFDYETFRCYDDDKLVLIKLPEKHWLSIASRFIR